MRFKATLTPTSGPGSTISLGDTEIKGVQSVEISAAVHDITTVKIAVIGIDAIVEGGRRGNLCRGCNVGQTIPPCGGRVMAKFRKKPVVIEAEQLIERTEIKTLEGVMVGNPGDWLITGVAGERYPCRDDIFRATYEEVE